jgi:fumarylacetoacetate (FAA) hydrolase
MKLVTYRGGAPSGRAGVWQDGAIFDAAALLGRAEPLTMNDLLRLGRSALDDLRGKVDEADPTLAAHTSVTLADLLAPTPDPPSVRDFYVFEQHVKASRARRNLEMIPEWYEFPVFYFSNPAAIQGPEVGIPHPNDTHEMDFELEIACVIGTPGRDIPAEEASRYIAGYMVMNDWSARDIWRRLESKLNMGPAKAKDFATSLGPWLVTPDELADRIVGEGAQERLDLTMLGRVNDREVSRGNAKDVYYTFGQMIEWASRHVTLRPGDVIGSGTVGTGCIFELGPENVPWLQPGDTVELEIERLGVLRNPILEEEQS